MNSKKSAAPSTLQPQLMNFKLVLPPAIYQRSAVNTVANNQAPAVTPAVAANSHAPAVTPVVAANNQAPAVTPVVAANNQAPAVTPVVAANSRAPGVTPVVAANSHAPGVTPVVAANSHAPDVTPAVAANSQAPGITPAIAANSQARGVTAVAPNSSLTSRAEWRFGWNAIAAIATVVATALAGVAGIYMSKTYDSTVKTYESNVDTAKRTLRAYVGMDSVSLQFPDLSKPNYKPEKLMAGTLERNRIRFVLKNFGSTPARNVVIYASWQPEPFLHQPSADFSFLDLRQRQQEGIELPTSKVVIQKDQQWPTDIAVHDLTPFRQAAHQEKTIYLYGHINYEDVYGEAHETKFCYILQPDWILVPYRRNNSAD